MNTALSVWVPAEVRKAVGLSVALLLMDGCNLLSVAAVADPVHAIGGRLRWLSPEGVPVLTSIGITLPVEGHAGNLSGADLVFILGGDQPLTARLRNDLRFVSAMGPWICATGSAVTLLAEAGLLQNRKFSLPEDQHQEFSDRFPALNPLSERFTIDNRLATCPEGPVVIDVVLHFLIKVLGAESLRHLFERGILSPPKVPSDLPPSQQVGSSTLQNALYLIGNDFAEPDVLSRAETTVAVSRRQLERLFNVHLQTTPSRYVKELRLSKAQQLLKHTTYSVEKVAYLAGFGSAAQLSRLYRLRYGHSPHMINLPQETTLSYQMGVRHR